MPEQFDNSVYDNERLVSKYDKMQALDDNILDDPQTEKIYELQQENRHLRGQITYLQEQLSSVEDDLDKARDRYEDRIAELEQQLGDALYGDR